MTDTGEGKGDKKVWSDFCAPVLGACIIFHLWAVHGLFGVDYDTLSPPSYVLSITAGLHREARVEN